MNIVAKPKSEMVSKSAINEKIFNLFICFLAYSFIGWFIETIYMSIYHGHLVKRGFLIGPLCVVYGISSIIVIYILNNFKSHPFGLFVGASLLTTVVELLAGLLLDRLITKRLWDYTGDFANFMGLVCLRNTMIWGILSLFLVYVIHPFIFKFIALIPLRTKEILCFSVIICLSLDISISIYSSLHGVNNLVWISQVFMNRMP